MFLASVPTGADPVWGLGLGVVLFLGAVTVLGVTIGLRGKTRKRLADDVDIAFSGLAERALEQLRALQAELNTLIPSPDEPFNPEDVIFDPVRLENPTRDGLKVIRRQRRIRGQYERLLWVCSATKYVAGAFVLFDALATAAYFFFFSEPGLWATLCIAAAVFLVLGGLLAGAFAYLNTQVESSIEKARPAVVVPGGIA